MSIKSENKITDAELLSLAMRMVGVSAGIALCDLILRTQKVAFKKKGNFSLEDAAKIRAEHDDLFEAKAEPEKPSETNP